MSVTYTYPTISTVTVTTRAKGDSDTAALKLMFRQTPSLGVPTGDEGSVVLTTGDTATYKTESLALLLDGTVEENSQVGTFSKDYSDAPDYETVVIGGGGLPASPWVPNPNSPGAGSVNPADQPSAGIYGQTVTNGAHAGSSTDAKAEGRNPSASSTKMSVTESPLTAGKSPASDSAPTYVS